MNTIQFGFYLKFIAVWDLRRWQIASWKKWRQDNSKAVEFLQFWTEHSAKWKFSNALRTCSLYTRHPISCSAGSVSHALLL